MRKELKAKVSGQKHELVDKCALFITMAYIISDEVRSTIFGKPVAPYYDLIRAAGSQQYSALSTGR